jgi:hypothetical protein
VFNRTVMAGLDPAIHAFVKAGPEAVDATREGARPQVYPTVQRPSDLPCPPHISRLFPEANAPFV